MEAGPIWLLLYIFMNLMTTLLNKAILNNLGFPYPMVLSLWHYTCSAVGALIAIHVFKATEPAKLDKTAHRKLFFFSMLFNVNIVVSTVSLHMVSMALHQVIRALSPAFTVVLSFLWLGKRYNQSILLSLVVIFVGVVLYASKGEVNYTTIGLLVTLSGGLLAALKGILTNQFMVGSLKLHPLDLLQYMSSFAALQLVLLLTYNGQLQEGIAVLRTTENTNLLMVFALNGFGAFMLNVVSFQANKSTSPLAMNIGGITKQIMAILLGIFVFGTAVTTMSALGVMITSTGIVAYARASYVEKQRQAESAKATLPNTNGPTKM